MTERTMRHALPIIALTVLAWSSAGAPHVAAQAINSNATIYITPEGGKEAKVENGANVYISNAQCRGKWRIELQGYTVKVPYLEMWVANSVNTNCADPNNRLTNNLQKSVCIKAGVRQAVNPKATFEFASGAELFDFDGDGQCDSIMGNKYKIQFVTLDSETLTGTGTVAAANNNPNQVAAILTMYTQIPPAPVSKSGSGGRRLTINYSKLASNDPLTEYRAYFERTDGVGGMDGGTCGGSTLAQTSTLDGGMVVPLRGDQLNVDGVNIFRTGTTKGDSLSIGDLDDKGIAFGSYTAAAVAAIDGAGTVGYLSNVQCIKREESIGYLGYCADGGADCGELESCSLSPRNTGSALFFSACTLAISAWTRRRRRSH